MGSAISRVATNLVFSSAAEIIAGAEANKAIAPDQLAASHLGVPAGEIKMWPAETVPAGYLECNGASVSRTTYAALFAVISTLYGTASGSTFNLPDLRGRFPRFWDHAKALDPDRATRTAPTTAGATITAGDHVGTEQVEGFKSHLHTYGAKLSLGALAGGTAGFSVNGNENSSSTGGNETRPVNTNLMPIIKY